MIRFLITTLPLALAAAAFANEPRLRTFCSPFDGKNCEVTWGAPTNELPASVKILKVVPAEFTPVVISNLLQAADLPAKSKRQPMSEGVVREKDAFRFGDKSESQYLEFVPSQGSIILYRRAIYTNAHPKSVPADADARTRALALVRMMGISRSELATGPDGDVAFNFATGTRLVQDEASGQWLTNVVHRMVSVNRRIGGLPVSGPAGISMRFGEEGKLGYLTVVWRAVRPDKECVVPTPAEFIDRIKSGRALVRNHQATIYRKLAVKKVSLCYWEYDNSRRQDTIYPFAVLETEASRDDGQSLAVPLFVLFANE